MEDSRNILKFDETGTIVTGCKDKSVTEIVIPDGVTCIGDFAFQSCTNLASIEIPNSVTNIGKQTFDGCTVLTSIEIPHSMTNIGQFAFEGCTGLTSIEMSNNVTSIGDRAFYHCTNLTLMEFPCSVKSIGYSAFEGCTGLTSIEMPNNVTYIGKMAFKDCTGLISIELSDNVAWIEESTFSNCTNLTSIEIPHSVSHIGYDAFKGCSNLKSINNQSNPNYYCSEGVLYTKDMKVLLKMPEGKNGEHRIDTSTIAISMGAFYRSALNSIKLSDRIMYIWDCAFEDASIQELHIRNEHPENLEIGKNAFKGLENCTLYVPIGTGYAYRHHPAFAGKFKEVIIER